MKNEMSLSALDVDECAWMKGLKKEWNALLLRGDKT